jgi:Fur family transcriptional regulator, zinc uptake regulator
MKKQTLIEQSLETLKNNGFKYTKKKRSIVNLFSEA